MPKPAPDRGKDAKRQPLQVVRGGAVCDPHEKGGHILKGSMSAAVCMPTLGTDPRPRYREAGRPSTPPSRHSIQWAQHRQGGKPYGK